MIIRLHTVCCGDRRGEQGFTLTEMMVTSAILMVVLAGTLTAHLFGIRMFEITKAKLGANDEARAALGSLIEEVRSSKRVLVGDGTISTFTETPVNTPQRGSALQIYPTTATNQFIRYYWDAGAKQLRRVTNGTTSFSVVANFITNGTVFALEDYRGNVLSTNVNNRVVSLTLQFYQLQYPVVPVGSGGYYDYYQFRAKVTRRMLE